MATTTHFIIIWSLLAFSYTCNTWTLNYMGRTYFAAVTGSLAVVHAAVAICFAIGVFVP